MWADQLKTHVYQRSVAAFARGDAARDGIRSRAALGRRQREPRWSCWRIPGLRPQRRRRVIMNRESYLWSGQAQDAEQIWPGFTAAGYDHEDILLAMCPKPVRVLAVESDFFPIEGTRRTVERCRRLWDLGGKPGNLDLVEDAATHAYTPRLAAAAAEFFAQHFLGVRKRVVARGEVFPPDKLWCTKSGQVVGELPGARAVYHENQQALKECAKLFQPPKASKRPVTLAVWDGGTTALRAHGTWIRSQCRKGRAVLVLDVSGVGALRPNPLNSQPPLEFYGVIHKLASDLLWLGDDLAALRAYDVTRALDVIGIWPGLDADKVECHAHGNHGVYAQLAAALDRRIRKIQVVGGIGSYTAFVRKHHYAAHDIHSILLHGLLPVCDLPALSKTLRAGNDARIKHSREKPRPSANFRDFVLSRSVDPAVNCRHDHRTDPRT